MQIRNDQQRWGTVSQLLHWLVAGAIIATMALGWYMVNLPLSPAKLQYYVLHKSIGITILAVVLLRLLWRVTNPTPRLPDNLKPWERFAAHATHILMYVLIIAMPLSGWVINSAANFPLEIFGLFKLPNIAPASKALQDIAETVHLLLFWCIVTLLVLHIGAALKHHFIMKDDVLTRMLPGADRRSSTASPQTHEKLP